jgi:hypothetical protein
MKFLLPFVLSAYPLAAVAQSLLPSSEPPSDAMPLSKANLIDHDYVPVGPLTPLSALIAR